MRKRNKQRVLKSYKKGNLSDLEKVFSSTTWRQAIYRSNYLKLISDIEKKITKRIEKLLVNISRQKVELEVGQSLPEVEALLGEPHEKIIGINGTEQDAQLWIYFTNKESMQLSFHNFKLFKIEKI